MREGERERERERKREREREREREQVGGREREREPGRKREGERERDSLCNHERRTYLVVNVRRIDQLSLKRDSLIFQLPTGRAPAAALAACRCPRHN